MMASRAHLGVHSRTTNWQTPTTTSQFLTTNSQVDVQARTQLNGDRSIGGRNKSQGDSRTSCNASDGKSTNLQQRHGN
jgi:hypothetical protein